ncbi:putative Cupredoxin [Mycena kentingensis (nom. inval.)]|nr:putative Cupredoxin [Mycena kentingensis (nom. inval.)]
MTKVTFGAALAVALLPAAFAQNTIDVNVGPTGAFIYDPPSVTAAPGDIIRFTFNPKNHTVTQSSFDQPCVPIVGGATSGFRPVSNASALLPQWTFTVANSNPAWFFCEQIGHCGLGMNFAINAPAAPDPHSFETFQELAKKLNGTDAGTPPPTSAPAEQPWQTATATVTHGQSTWTTIYTSYEGTPQPTFAPEPVAHSISVGENGLTFTPSNISAAIGDTVTFTFHPKAHSVTQSSFSNPCKPLANTSLTGQVGFDSGLMPVAQDATELPKFTITINDTAPIWGYCKQQGPPVHCSQGMVFSISAVESGPNNFAAFQALAKAGSSASSDSPSGSGGSGTASGSPADSSNAPNAALAASVYAPGVILGSFIAGLALL